MVKAEGGSPNRDRRNGVAFRSLLHWRKLRPGEIDHELIWLPVSIVSAASAWAWLRLSLPTPACTFRLLTGCACPTCGATRAVTQLFHGNIAGALHWNPLITCAALGMVAFDLYAVAVLISRSPRLRWEPLSPRTTRTLRVAVIAVVLVNWIWLVRTGV